MDEMVCQESQGLTEFMVAVVWMDCLDLTEFREPLGHLVYQVPMEGTEIKEFKAIEDQSDLREREVCPGKAMKQ